MRFVVGDYDMDTLTTPIRVEHQGKTVIVSLLDEMMMPDENDTWAQVDERIRRYLVGRWEAVHGELPPG